MSDNSDKYRYLAKNIGLLTLSSFATKILTFLLVPLYTNILSTEEYGINDLFHTTVSILVPILTLNIQEAVMRFALDENSNRKEVISVGFKYLFTGSAIVIAGLCINHFLRISLLFDKYSIFFFLIFLTQAVSGIVMAYSRGIDRIADLSISSVISSIITVVCNVLFLVVFRWGLIGYFVACIAGPFIQSIFLALRTNIFKDIIFSQTIKYTQQEMTTYSRPMIANSIGWWINNAADKYVVIWFLGLAENGIYSVAAKIPSILNVLQSIFAQAWTLSAVKDFDKEDRNGFFAKTYATYNCVMTVGCSLIIATDKILAKFFYAKESYAAWRFVPWLTIAIVFGALSGYIGGFFSAVKNSKIYGTSTMIGAGFNLLLNIILTPQIGAMGAAIATAVSYCIVWIFRFIHSKKFIKLRINLMRDVASYVLLLVQTIILLFLDGIQLYFLELLVLTIIIILYKLEIIGLLDKVVKTVQRRFSRV